jgi:hypothetical protein
MCKYARVLFCLVYFDLRFCICQLGYFIIDFRTEIEVSSIFVERKEDLYLDYTTLSEFILSRKITPKECYCILRQIALGICFLHQKNVTMRTKICPDNVFIFMSKNVSTSWTILRIYIPLITGPLEIQVAAKSAG